MVDTEVVGKENGWLKRVVFKLQHATTRGLKLKEAHWLLPLQTCLSLARRLVGLKLSEKATLTHHALAGY